MFTEGKKQARTLSTMLLLMLMMLMMMMMMMTSSEARMNASDIAAARTQLLRDWQSPRYRRQTLNNDEEFFLQQVRYSRCVAFHFNHRTRRHNRNKKFASSLTRCDPVIFQSVDTT